MSLGLQRKSHDATRNSRQKALSVNALLSTTGEQDYLRAGLAHL